jgi:hypothetical protein
MTRSGVGPPEGSPRTALTNLEDTVPADTRFLPADGHLDTPALSSKDTDSTHRVFAVRRDRCVAELTIRLLGIRWLRARLTVSHASLTIEAGEHTLAIELATASLRTAVPLLAKVLTGDTALRAEVFPCLYFLSDEVAILNEPTVEIVGQAEIAGSPRDLFLEGELRHIESGRVILWLRGVLPPPRRSPAKTGRTARFLARRPVHIEFAAEFAR